MEQVRTATRDDLDRVAELVAGSLAARAAWRGAAESRPDDAAGPHPEATVRALTPYLAGGDRTALVATLDGWVAGAALCRASGDGPARRGVLEVCFVEEGAREVGLGHLLLDAALAWFRSVGCTGVDGTAHPGDRSAKSFYETAGFKARLLVMHLPLD